MGLLSHTAPNPHSIPRQAGDTDGGHLRHSTPEMWGRARLGGLQPTGDRVGDGRGCSGRRAGRRVPSPAVPLLTPRGKRDVKGWKGKYPRVGRVTLHTLLYLVLFMQSSLSPWLECLGEELHGSLITSPNQSSQRRAVQHLNCKCSRERRFYAGERGDGCPQTQLGQVRQGARDTRACASAVHLARSQRWRWSLTYIMAEPGVVKGKIKRARQWLIYTSIPGHLPSTALRF